jgi:hypothetical protein
MRRAPLHRRGGTHPDLDPQSPDKLTLPSRVRFYYIGTHPPLVAVPSIICSQWGGRWEGMGSGGSSRARPGGRPPQSSAHNGEGELGAMSGDNRYLV